LSLKSFGDPIPTPRSVFEEEINSSRVSNVVIRLKGETKSHNVSNKKNKYFVRNFCSKRMSDHHPLLSL
jgi:hypothetical protein